MQHARAPAPMALSGLAPTPDGDWLAIPEADLEAMHGESLAVIGCPDTADLTGRAAASLVLLHQLMVARAVVRALGQPPTAARAALRSDFARGYLFGLASGGDSPDTAPRTGRRFASTLTMLHQLIYGRQVAARLHVNAMTGKTVAVGEGFGAGMLAAMTDLAALGRWWRGDGGAWPLGLLDALPSAAWCRDRGEASQPH